MYTITCLHSSTTRPCTTDAHGRVRLEDIASAINFSLPEKEPVVKINVKELVHSKEFLEIVSSAAKSTQTKRIPVITVQSYRGKRGTYVATEVAVELAIRHGYFVEKSTH